MLAKKNRISRSEFLNLQKESLKKVFTDIGTFFYKKTEKKEIQWSVVISSKIYKKAVERNSLRRKIYTYIQKYNKKTPIVGYLIIGKKSITLSDDDMYQIIYEFFKKNT